MPSLIILAAKTPAWNRAVLPDSALVGISIYMHTITIFIVGDAIGFCKFSGHNPLIHTLPEEKIGSLQHTAMYTLRILSQSTIFFTTLLKIDTINYARGVSSPHCSLHKYNIVMIRLYMYMRIYINYYSECV